jgi:selenocysteine lyase/cysteine desulfurase
MFYSRMDNDDLGNRNFYTLPKRNETSKPTLNSSATPEELTKLILENEIGKDHLFISAFGKRSLTYCDHTASGRPLSFIENFIQKQVLPTYANTHTTSSITGLQSTLFRHEARSIIRNAVR